MKSNQQEKARLLVVLAVILGSVAFASDTMLERAIQQFESQVERAEAPVIRAEQALALAKERRDEAVERAMKRLIDQYDRAIERATRSDDADAAARFREAKEALEKRLADMQGEEIPEGEQEAVRQQQETARTLRIREELVVDLPNGVKMEFVLIPPGDFLRGSPDDDEMACQRREFPQRRIRITKAFYMAKYPTTQQQWQAVMGGNPSRFTDNPRNPVEGVSWVDINERFLPAMQPHAPRGMTFNIPSEAQWEYACRAGTTTRYYFGDKLTAEQANFNQTLRHTTPVGSYPPNAWGLHDMHGNVWEWCQDWRDGIFYRTSPSDDPVHTTPGTYRILRGGSWRDSEVRCRSAYRNYEPPTESSSRYSVRLILELP